MNLEKALLDAEDPLRPFGELDCLPYYVCAAKRLAGFLGGKSIAAKITLPKQGMEILRRESKLGKLSIQELAKCTRNNFFEKERKLHLKDARKKISRLEEKCWEYFYPRKPVEMHYSTNGEGKDRPLERIYFDIDAVDGDTEGAGKAAGAIIKAVEEDRVFAGIAGIKKTVALWTGMGFHAYMLLKKPVPHSFYEKHLQYSEREGSFTQKWAEKAEKETGLEVRAGHEKERGAIVIDPSQSPSGKLARAPFSLNLDKKGSVRGIAVPVAKEDLCRKGIEQELKAYDVKKCLREMDSMQRIL